MIRPLVALRDFNVHSSPTVTDDTNYKKLIHELRQITVPIIGGIMLLAGPVYLAFDVPPSTVDSM